MSSLNLILSPDFKDTDLRAYFPKINQGVFRGIKIFFAAAGQFVSKNVLINPNSVLTEITENVSTTSINLSTKKWVNIKKDVQALFHDVRLTPEENRKYQNLITKIDHKIELVLFDSTNKKKRSEDKNNISITSPFFPSEIIPFFFKFIGSSK